MTDERPARFYLPPAAKHDLERLHRLAEGTPPGSEARRLAVVAMNTVLEIKRYGVSTHPLEYLSSYPDLSDCRTTYVGNDPDRKPSHRVVWREIPADEPGQLPLREIVAIGERQNGQAYHVAGQRLGRPVGVTLHDLAALREPIAQHTPTRERFSEPQHPELQPEFG
jgi:hypothetical protein